MTEETLKDTTTEDSSETLSDTTIETTSSDTTSDKIYRIIDIVDVDGVSTAKIISTKSSSEYLYPNDFKSKVTDSTIIYQLNNDLVESTISEQQSTIDTLKDNQQTYETTKANLEAELSSEMAAKDAKEAEIQTFESNHKYTPEGDTEENAYFDASKLDTDDAEEYNTLVSELTTINSQITTTESNITENNKLDKTEQITTLETELSNFKASIASYEVGTSIPIKYLSTVTISETTMIPTEDYIYVIAAVEDTTERDFSDTESENTPYYYLIGKFENHEVNGNTTQCIVFTNISSYDDLKTYTNLKTYHSFNSIYLTSSVVKKYINSFRDLSLNNAISEDGKTTILDNETTFFTMKEFSSIEITDNSAIIPSLSVLIQTTEDESKDDSSDTSDDSDSSTDTTTDSDDYDEYLRSGQLFIINDIMFVVPENSEAVKKIVYVNGYYYILMNNCYIYKLNEDFDLITTMDLSKLSSDISLTNIFSVGNMLIIQSDKTYVTDLESVKNNYGISDTDVTINSVKVNTKTIVKILLK